MTVRAMVQLRKDHRTIKDLFHKFQKSNNPEEKTEIAAMAFRELKLHSALEEEIFYPMLESRLEISDLIGEAFDEHQTISILIDELEIMDIHERDFNEKFTELVESVKHHMEEEETEIIPVAEENLELEDLEELNNDMADRRQTLVKEIIQESSDRRMRERRKQRRSPLAY